jgi:hypothetical protein
MPDFFLAQQAGDDHHQAKEYSEYQQYLQHGFLPIQLLIILSAKFAYGD